MSDRRLVYLTSWRATIYATRRGVLSLGPTFANDEDGYQQFANYLNELPKGTLLYVLADVVEEDFHVETIPFVRGGDRKQLVNRRLAQRYRDTSLSLALSLGTERSQRRDERLLLSSFTNTQLFQPWLNVLSQSGLPVVGVYSVALVAAALAKRLGFGARAPALFVSLQPAGLRQTLVWDGKVRFSRLGPLDPADVDQPARVAAAFAGETLRIHQYLTAIRAIPRDGPQLDVLLLAPPGRKQLVTAAASDSAQLRYHVVDVAEAAHRLGLKDLPNNAGAEALYLYTLATQPPRQQYASEALRHQYRTWQGRIALLAGGGALFAACALLSGYQWFNVFDAQRRTSEELDRARAVSEDYARVTKGFPRVPTSSENLKLTVEQFGLLQKQTRAPESLLAELAAVLEASQSLELETLRWELGVNPREPGRDGRRQSSAAPARTDNTGQQTPDVRYDLVEVSGRITGIPSSNYRALANAVNEMVDRLRKRPGVEVLATKLPFDIGSETTLSGDLSESRPVESPSFQVVFGKRVGS
jgi:hypothetical protein